MNALNFDEMSNCLITLMDHSSINGDNVASGLENIGNGYKQSDNNYDSIINYCDQNCDFNITYFSWNKENVLLLPLLRSTFLRQNRLS